MSMRKAPKKAAVLVWAAAMVCGCTRATDPSEKSEAADESRAASVGLDSPIARHTGDKREGPNPVETSGIEAESTGIIEGSVRFTGETIPTSTIVPVAADVEFCGHEHSKEDYVIEAESRGIRYVIVRLTSKELRKWPHAKPAYLVLDNKDCRFEPHGAVLTVGSTIELCNSDPISHTTHAYFGTSFNYALPAKGSSIKHVFKFPGMTLIRCDMHGWMNAFIRVDRHPFHAVTDAQGRFKIIGVPAGKYTLVAWHEQFGPQRKSISVRASQTITEELTYPVSDEVNSTK